MPLDDQKEKWWVAVMEVGLDPELTKWSVHLGPATILTRKGYKEHHWLVVPSINHFSYLHFHTTHWGQRGYYPGSKLRVF